MPPRYTIVALQPAAEEYAPSAPSPHHGDMRRSSIAPPASLLSQHPRRMSLAGRKAMKVAELLASSSPLPPPPQIRDVDALVKTPGKEKKRTRSKRRAGRKAPTEKTSGSLPAAVAHQPRRTSRDIDELFAALELMPTSSPLPPRPVIRSEEGLAARAKDRRAETAAAADLAKKNAPSNSRRRPLRPALVEKCSNEGRKKMLRVQTKAQRLDLGARAKAVAAKLERQPVPPPAAPSTPPQASRKMLTPLRITLTASSPFDTDVD